MLWQTIPLSRKLYMRFFITKVQIFLNYEDPSNYNIYNILSENDQLKSNKKKKIKDTNVIIELRNWNIDLIQICIFNFYFVI